MSDGQESLTQQLFSFQVCKDNMPHFKTSGHGPTLVWVAICTMGSSGLKGQLSTFPKYQPTRSLFNPAMKDDLSVCFKDVC